MAKRNISAYAILSIMLFTSCYQLRKVPCSKEGANYLQIYSNVIEEKRKEPIKTFQYNQDLPHPNVRLPDSLLGSQLYGRIDMLIYLDTDMTIHKTEILSMVLYKDKGWQKYFHDYRPHCKKKPLRTRFHKRILGYLDEVVEDFPYKQLRVIQEDERNENRLYPVFAGLEFNPAYPLIEPFLDSLEVNKRKYDAIFLKLND